MATIYYIDSDRLADYESEDLGLVEAKIDQDFDATNLKAKKIDPTPQGMFGAWVIFDPDGLDPDDKDSIEDCLFVAFIKSYQR